jgi:hypothetical protein
VALTSVVVDYDNVCVTFSMPAANGKRNAGRNLRIHMYTW